MKRIQTMLALMAVGLALNVNSAPRPADPPAIAPPRAKEGEKAATPAESAPATPAAATPAQEGTNSSQAAVVTGDGLLRLNLRNVPLDQVLNYFSDAAGYIINVRPGTSVRGKVDVWSNQPLTKEDALALLDTVLNQNGLARVLTGKTLTIVNRDEVKTQAIPVNIGTEPESIPQSDQVVTQIIPVRFVEVGQLLKDLQPLVSMQTTMTANEAGNAIVITDTQTSIRRVAEIIKAIDSGAEAFTEVRVFRLLNADATEMADTLTSLFPDDTRQGNSQSPVRFGGIRGLFGGGPGGGPFGGGFGNNAAGGDNSARLKKRARVIAVPDPRTASVVVSAAKELMDQIAEVVTTLDNDSKGRTSVATFNIAHADLQEILPVLQDMFQKNTTTQSRNSQNQTDSLYTRLQQQQQSSSSASSTSSRNSSGIGGNRSGGGSLP
jgi:general secretion pathway protein D